MSYSRSGTNPVSLCVLGDNCRSRPVNLILLADIEFSPEGPDHPHIVFHALKVVSLQLEEISTFRATWIHLFTFRFEIALSLVVTTLGTLIRIDGAIPVMLT